MEGNKRVAVAVRVRPVLRDGVSLAHCQERFEMEGVHRVGDTALKVELRKQDEPTRSSMFTFDHIFDQESTQLEVYEDAVVDLVDAALAGTNATVLAYGQTGSGKTFSVLGDVKPNPLENDLLTHESGLFLRVLSDLMDYKLRQAKRGVHVVIGLSCVEIYNENVRDLFGGKVNTPPPPLKAVMIGDDVLLPSLIIKEMTSLQGVFNEIQLAISRRKSRATDANATSSRSHCLFTIDILQQSATGPAPSLSILDQKRDQSTMLKRQSVVQQSSDLGLRDGEIPFNGTMVRIPGQVEPVYMSKIIIADLAGSERISKTGVSGQGLAEATSINGSLTALGNVVHSLHEGSYVSYRVSNLTRLLKPTFSHPNSRVLLLAQVSPTQLTFEETISSLHFANKVKAMKVTTTTGAEVEKLQFDYIEAEKVADALLADLHIWQVEQNTKAGTIHRYCIQNDGLFFEKPVKGKKWNPKERRVFLESVGAIAAAEKERQELLRKKEAEDQAAEAERLQKIQESRATLIKEHAEQMKEVKESIAVEQDHRKHNVFQMLQIDASATSTQIIEEEESEFAQLRRRFEVDHIAMLTKVIRKSDARNEELNSMVASLRVSQGITEIPETAEDNRFYGNSTWSHCVAKRFFSSCMELREAQLALINIHIGLSELDDWKRKNKDLIAEGTA